MHKFLDERRDIAVIGNNQETIQFSTQYFIDLANEAIKKNNRFTVALSGGSTPQAIFKELAKDENKNKVDWNKVYVFFSDERFVPLDNLESNFKMAMDSGFSSLPIPKDHIYPAITDKIPEISALHYEKLIHQKVPNSSFDLVMLGMGDDGHTASLFPNTQALNEKKHLVVANFIPQKDTWRITFTFQLINNAQNIAIFVLGKSKASILKEVLIDKGSKYPIEKVGTKEHKALFILDKDAASLLP